ncbi:hypothetical protein FRC12_020774, partial [Ceratobasidium sp. 428]
GGVFADVRTTGKLVRRRTWQRATYVQGVDVGESVDEALGRAKGGAGLNQQAGTTAAETASAARGQLGQRSEQSE